MIGTSRLNGLIRAWEEGRPAVVSFAQADRQTSIRYSTAGYDGVVFDMEHSPWDTLGLQDALQYLLSRREIATAASLAPTVTPFVRIPPNGVEMDQQFAKQALDRGVYGIVWPHISNAEQAHNAVAACRYPRPKSEPNYEPRGLRGDGPNIAARYWGLPLAEYYERADVWPLCPEGEILVLLIIENMQGVANLESILGSVPGIGGILIGEGDLSKELGCPRQYENPALLREMSYIVETCKKYNVVVGHPHVNAQNIESVIEMGYQILCTTPAYTDEALVKARALAPRA